MMTCLAMVVASTSLAADLPEPALLPANGSLPDPLVMRDGTRVADKLAWQTKRAPELRALFQHYMYGTRPPQPLGVVGKLIREDKAAFGGKATLREVEVSCGLPATVHLLVVFPNSGKKPFPCFLGLNVNGNYQLVEDPLVTLPRWAIARKAGQPSLPDPAARGREKEMWALEQSIDRGYAVATFYSGDVVPDDREVAEQTLKKLAKNNCERVPSGTAAIMAWAWGYSRMLDYLQSVPEINAKKVAVVGHARNGKTALLAGAFDERFAVVIPSQSGCGGSAPDRVNSDLATIKGNGRPTAETIGEINRAYPHWFSGNFKAFNQVVEKLPFDQHALIALCAPRPVLLSNAAANNWSNPDGQYAMQKAAAPVYALFGQKLNLPEARPAVDQLLNERLGYYIRPGNQAMNTSDWKVWLDYADKWLK